MTLDDFVRLCDEKQQAEVAERLLRADPYNPGIYDKVIAKTKEITGDNPAVDSETGGMKELSPYAIRRLLLSWRDSANGKVERYGSENLESLLNSLNKAQLSGLLLSTQPQKISNHEEVVKLHEEYMQLAGTVEVYRKSEDPEERKKALLMIYQIFPKLIARILKAKNNDRKKEDKLSDDEMRMWEDSLTYVALVNPGYALKKIGERAEEITAEIRRKLDTEDKLKDYITKNAKETEQKELFFDVLYRLLKP